MGCCTSQDQKIQAVLEKMEVVNATSLKEGDIKFVVGRIAQAPVGQLTIAPIKNKSCAYYKFELEEEREREYEVDGQRRVEKYWAVDFVHVSFYGR